MRGRKLQNTHSEISNLRIYRGYISDMTGDGMATIMLEQYVPEKYRVSDIGVLETIQEGGMSHFEFEMPINQIRNPKESKIVLGTYIEASIMFPEDDCDYDSHQEVIVSVLDTGKVTEADIARGKAWAKRIMKSFGLAK